MEASDGEEEKSQKGNEEEEVDSARRPARPQEMRSRNAGPGNRPGKLRRNRQRQNGSGSSTALRRGRARGRTCPEPRSSLVVHVLSAGCEWTAVGPGPCAPNRTADIQCRSFLQFFQKVLPEFCDFRPDYESAVRLRGVSPEIFLMVILRHVELGRRHDFGDDGIFVD